MSERGPSDPTHAERKSDKKSNYQLWQEFQERVQYELHELRKADRSEHNIDGWYPLTPDEQTDILEAEIK